MSPVSVKTSCSGFRRILAALLVFGFGLGMVIVVADEGVSIVRKNITFTHAGNTLKGVLVLPDSMARPESCMVFVHGSGDMPRDAYGYYEPL